jgi:hypothetical protein
MTESVIVINAYPGNIYMKLKRDVACEEAVGPEEGSSILVSVWIGFQMYFPQT